MRVERSFIVTCEHDWEVWLSEYSGVAIGGTVSFKNERSKQMNRIDLFVLKWDPGPDLLFAHYLHHTLRIDDTKAVQQLAHVMRGNKLSFASCILCRLGRIFWLR